MEVRFFTNNPYQENTYILFDETGEAAIIDPGMYNSTEQNAVTGFIREHNLKPVLLLNTHCHIEHVLGNKFVFETYGLKPQFHEAELPLLTAVPSYAPAQGFYYEPGPLPESFLSERGSISFGQSTLDLIFAPGHSPGHLCFYHPTDKVLIGGDVLFHGSIGRTDLPGGNHELLIKNIREKLFALPDEVVVYPGHGAKTLVGFEKKFNPFLNR